jgi:hypothetical protein
MYSTNFSFRNYANYVESSRAVESESEGILVEIELVKM